MPENGSTFGKGTVPKHIKAFKDNYVLTAKIIKFICLHI